METWPSLENYPKKYCYYKNNCSLEMNSLKEEVDIIKAGYKELADKFSYALTDTCSKFYDILENHNNINLYEDHIHPNMYGSFLNACILYKTITKHNSSSINFSGNIEKKKVKLLKAIADK